MRERQLGLGLHDLLSGIAARHSCCDSFCRYAGEQARRGRRGGLFTRRTLKSGWQSRRLGGLRGSWPVLVRPLFNVLPVWNLGQLFIQVGK